jgi:hypothetical protein
MHFPLHTEQQGDIAIQVGVICKCMVTVGLLEWGITCPTRPYCKPEIVDTDEGDIIIKVCVFWCNTEDQKADAFPANCTVGLPGLCSA